jgi:hypothetical protein
LFTAVDSHGLLPQVVGSQSRHLSSTLCSLGFPALFYCLPFIDGCAHRVLSNFLQLLSLTCSCLECSAPQKFPLAGSVACWRALVSPECWWLSDLFPSDLVSSLRFQAFNSCVFLCGLLQVKPGFILKLSDQEARDFTVQIALPWWFSERAHQVFGEMRMRI